jgi:hypothetical protein
VLRNGTASASAAAPVRSSTFRSHFCLLRRIAQSEGTREYSAPAIDEHLRVGDVPVDFGKLLSHSQRGESWADLPVQAPTKYDLVINLKTAKALSLEIPDKRSNTG